MSKKTRLKKGRNNVRKNVQASLRNQAGSAQAAIFERFDRLNAAVTQLKENKKTIVEKVTLVRNTLQVPYVPESDGLTKAATLTLTEAERVALADHLTVALDKLGAL